MTRAERRRRKRSARLARSEMAVTASGQHGQNTAPEPRSATETGETVIPTPERLKRGYWPERGSQGLQQDEHPDMIGRLHQQGALSQSQHDAARLWQDIRAAWVAELGVTGYRSCIGDFGGHDETDGNVEAVKRYLGLRDKIGRVAEATLRIECDKPADAQPISLAVLRNALDRVNA